MHSCYNLFLEVQDLGAINFLLTMIDEFLGGNADRVKFLSDSDKIPLQRFIDLVKQKSVSDYCKRKCVIIAAIIIWYFLYYNCYIIVLNMHHPLIIPHFLHFV